MSGPPDIGQLMQQAQQMQEKMSELQRELASRRFEAGAGGGMIVAVVSGELKVLEIRIEPAIFETRDRAMIQDLTAAAVNAALSKAQQWAQEQMQQLSLGGGLPIDPASLFGGQR